LNYWRGPVVVLRNERGATPIVAWRGAAAAVNHSVAAGNADSADVEGRVRLTLRQTAGLIALSSKIFSGSPWRFQTTPRITSPDR
jgi:hypothetical protein